MLSPFARKPYRVGYMTGCFDLPHRAHFSVLRRAKALCDTLIVGLTTDERCVVEKRQPILDFEHRACILRDCRYVDVVVANVGDPKARDWKKLRFDVVFSEPGRMDSEEFKVFRQACPDVPVVFLSRTLGISTSELIDQMQYRFMSELEFFKLSLNGPILRSGKTLMKPVHIGVSEYQTIENVYHMPFPNLPRNWKRIGEVHRHPNISGVNSNREIQMLDVIGHEPWNPLLHVKEVYSNPHVHPIEKRPLFGHMQEERRYPRAIVWLYMRYAGPTMEEWVEEHQEDDTFVPTFLQMIEEVRRILVRLLDLRVVHGDVHPRNLCLLDNRLSLVDWGWCMSARFEPMGDKERQYFHNCLNSWFDWHHFLDSLEYMYNKRPWWKDIAAKPNPALI